MKRARTAFVIVASMLAVALLAPGASAKFTTHTVPPIVTETDTVQGSDLNTCGDHISGRSGWSSAVVYDQSNPLPTEATSGTALYEVYSFPAGWGNISQDQKVFVDPPYYQTEVGGVTLVAPRIFTFTTTAPRNLLPPPELLDNGGWVYTDVRFDEAVSPAAPVGSTLGIGPPGNVILRKLTVVDCYTFTGFTAPVDNGIVNIAKAGSAIPLKFRVTDANSAPVTGLTAPPVAVTSKGAPCGSDPGDAIEEYAAGNSGLQNLGNGYYQFNWKTPKAYKGQCRTVTVSLGDGNETHTAQFSFR